MVVRAIRPAPAKPRATADRPSAGRGVHSAAWLVVALFLALTIVLLFPLSIRPATHARDLGDTLLNTWILAWVTRAMFRDPLSLFEGNIFYPFPHSVAFSEVLVANLPLVAPIIWLTGNPLLAHNAVALASFFLSGIGACWLVKHLTGSWPAGMAGGIIFAFAPFKFAQIAHVQLLTAQWMPLSFLFLHRALAGRRWRDCLAFGGCFALQALSSFYYAYILALGIALFLAYSLAITRRLDRICALRLLVAGALAGAVILPFGLPYFQVQREYGFTRGLTEIRDNSADLLDYFSAPPENILYGTLTKPLTNPGAWPAEHYLFLGLIPLLLAAGGLLSVRWFRARPEGAAEPRRGLELRLGATRDQGFYLLLGLTSFVLSLGPTLHLFWRDTGVPLPYRLLYELVPGFKALRVPTRFEILILLALAVLAGYGLVRMTAAISGWRRAGVGAARARMALAGLIVPFLIVAEYASFPLPIAAVPVGSDVQPVYAWLAQQPRRPMIELPIDDPGHNFQYEYFSTYHWQPIVNGHSGFVPDDFWRIVREMDAFPSPRSLDLIRGLGVELIVVHPDRYPPERRQRLAEQLRDAPGLSSLGAIGDAWVYQVERGIPPDPAAAIIAAQPPRQVARGSRFGLPLTVENGGSSGLVSMRDHVEVQGTWSGPVAAATTGRAALPFFVPAGEAEAVSASLAAPDRSGSYQFGLVLSAAGRETTLATTVEVVDALPDSLGRAGHRAELRDCDAPDRVEAGRPLTLHCTVVNVGGSVWLARPEEVRGWVGLGIGAWRDSRGQVAVDGAGQPLSGRAMLPAALWPGQAGRLTMRASAPPHVGTYDLEVDVVSEGVAWFRDLQASDPWRTRIRVE